MKPQPGERCNDPACGTFGFMIAAHSYVRRHTDDFFDLDADVAEFERKEAFTGCELVHETHRLALMNAILHDIDGEITLGDTLSNLGKGMKGYDLVLTIISSIISSGIRSKQGKPFFSSQLYLAKAA
jgi:type I restriction enzyme M protein